MRFVWAVFTAGAASVTSAAIVALATPVVPAALPLHECRLEHPLKLASVAAHCGSLRVALNPAHPDTAGIDLSVAVIPALNRRARAAPLFLLAGGPGQAASDLYVSY